MKVIAITQARVGSSRLPGKILKKIGDKTLLEIHIERILSSKKIDSLIVATTTEERDREIIDIIDKYDVEVFRGSEADVLDRFYKAVEDKSPDYIVRLTSDCPLIDASLIDKIVDFTISRNLDYASNTLNPTYPDGQDAEVFTMDALEQAWQHARLTSEREHVTPYIWKNSTYKGVQLFKSDNFEEGYHFGHLRMTVDEHKDYELLKEIIQVIGAQKTWKEYADFIEENPEILNINADIKRNEGFSKSLEKDQ